MRRAAIAVVAVALAAPPARAADAPNFKIDAAHTGASPERLRDPLRRVWTRRLPGAVSYPVVVDGRVFVSAWRRHRPSRIFALSARTGRVLWSTALPRHIGPDLAVTGQRLVWAGGAAAGAFDARTGTRLWTRQFPLERPFSCGGPTAHRGVVYAGCSGSEGSGLFAMSAADGRMLWTSSRAVDAAPAVAGDRLVTMGDPCIDAAAHDLASGRLLWGSTSVCERFGRTPVVYRGRAYIGDLLTIDGYSDPILDVADGREIGRVVTDLMPAFSAGLGFFVRLGVLRAERVVDARVLWRFRAPSNVVLSPVIVGRRVFAAAAGNRVYVLDRASGRVRQRLRLGPPRASYSEVLGPIAGLSVGARRLFVPARGRLVAFG